MVKPQSQSYLDWFQYADYKAHSDPAAARIKTHDFSYEAISEQDEVGWQQEEWSTSAVLVPLDTDEQRRRLESEFGRDFFDFGEDFAPSWSDEETIDFANERSARGVRVRPWIRRWRHPNRGDLVIVPRADFILYHGLDERVAADGVDFIHPTGGAVVLETRHHAVAFYAEMAFAEVHRDYLRDYLSARRAALLLTIIADRFANAASADELQIVDADIQIGPSAWIQTNLYPAGSYNSHFRGRSSLYWNVLIQPYERPKPSRSIWPYYGHEPLIDEEQPGLPDFKRGPEGTLERAGDAHPTTYYYFKPGVLQKYLDVESYGVFFHMRNWGSARAPSGSVDVGINSRGLLNGYARDIGALRASEQLHWAAYSVNADGEVCSELFETRMQQNPPHSPNVIEIIAAARESLRLALMTHFDIDPYRSQEPPERDKMRLSVGPITSNGRELPSLCQILYDWLIDPLRTDALRSLLEKRNFSYKSDDKQITLLKHLLLHFADETAAKTLVSPLRVLARLRVIAAHRTNSDVENELRQAGLDIGTYSDRAAYVAIVDYLEDGIARIAATIGPACDAAPVVNGH